MYYTLLPGRFVSCRIDNRGKEKATGGAIEHWKMSIACNKNTIKCETVCQDVGLNRYFNQSYCDNIMNSKRDCSVRIFCSHFYYNNNKFLKNHASSVYIKNYVFTISVEVYTY